MAFLQVLMLYILLYLVVEGAMLAENVEKCLLNAFIFQCFSGGGGFIRHLTA